jgi:extradiol dioxygenase family protein
VATLGCEAARARDGYQDIWFYGMQITLHCRPEEAASRYPDSVRHFGVTLGRDTFDTLIFRLESRSVTWISPVTTADEGSPTEQTKAKVADPSGNVIELKTYTGVETALEVSSSVVSGSGPPLGCPRELTRSGWPGPAAGAGCLILTHRWPTVSSDDVRREAEHEFGGPVA